MTVLEIYRGDRPTTPAFLRFVVSMEGALNGIRDSTNDEWLNEEIRQRHGWQSFQQADRIADAIQKAIGDN